MIDKFAVPFCLCLMAGMLIGLAKDEMPLWLPIGAAFGVILGLLLLWAEMGRRKATFGGN